MPDQKNTADEKMPMGLDERFLALLERQADIQEKLAERQDEGPIKQIPISKIKVKTPWHPSGDPNRPELSRRTYMNGFMVKEGLLSNEEIELFNQIKPGRYIGNKVLVVAVNSDKEDSSISVYVPNKTMEDRILQAQYAPSASVLLKTIIAEQSQIKA